MLAAMGILGRQFGRPSGLVGRLVGGLMARGNGSFNAVAVNQLRELYGELGQVAELGRGPGVALTALLEAFPNARVQGVDLSAQMLDQSRRRNAGAVQSGRLDLRQGDVEQISPPPDLLLAVHVLYFWHEPEVTLKRLRTTLASGAVLALGYRCRADMPPPAQRDFPREGHRLYESEGEVRALLTSAGFQDAESHSITSGDHPLGWLTTGRAPGR